MGHSHWDGMLPGGRGQRPPARAREPVGAATCPGLESTTLRPGSTQARILRVVPGRRVARTLALAMILPALAGAGEPVAPAAGMQAQESVAAARGDESPLDKRVRLLAAELRLTPWQQSQVRALLVRQRQQVAQLWRDPELAPALRIGRMQGVGDQTASAIRALLDDAQRRKYIQPLQREAAVGTHGADVEGWMAAEAGR